MSVREVIVIGAGPAGIAASIQLKRSGVGVTVFERSRIGGMLGQANLVENYPGFPEGISGRDLAALLRMQVERHNIEIVREEVTELNCQDGLFRVQTATGLFQSKVAIVASGTKPIELPVCPGDSTRMFYEIEPLFEHEGQNIVVVGGGDLAFDYALNLSSRNYVTIMNRSLAPKCIPILIDRASRCETIDYVGGVEIRSVDRDAEELVLNCQGNAGAFTVRCRSLLVSIGRQPRIDYLSVELKDRMNELIAKRLMYVIGDAANQHYRQVAISVGDGVRCAMEVFENMRKCLLCG